jgi:hypothetical protein
MRYKIQSGRPASKNHKCSAKSPKKGLKKKPRKNLTETTKIESTTAGDRNRCRNTKLTPSVPERRLRFSFRTSNQNQSTCPVSERLMHHCISVTDHHNARCKAGKKSSCQNKRQRNEYQNFRYQRKRTIRVPSSRSIRSR